MCRCLAYTGSPVSLDDLLFRPAHSLIDQSLHSQMGATTTTGGDHEGKAYTLTGPEAFTYDEVVGELSVALGRTITHVSLPHADMKAGMLAGGMPEVLADRLLDLERYFREGLDK